MDQPPLKTEALGVFQADLIIRSALLLAIKDLRKNPYLLDYCFASLPADAETAKEYGTEQVKKAKEWFQKTEIRVALNVNMNVDKFPCISISLMNSSEVEGEGTLADTHYQPREDNDQNWPILVGPLSPTGYDPVTGTLTFKTADLNQVVLAAGMIVVDKLGKQYEILESPTDNTVTIKPGLVNDFSNMVIKPAFPSFVTSLESTVFRETYAIGCHVDSEAVNLIYLHSIVVFALLRYKQSLLEARGFERSTLSSTDLRRDDETLPEVIYSRYIQITGAVRQYWPKITSPKINSVFVDAKAANDGIPTSTVEIDAFLSQDGLELK
jgi:hypothetical protein